jgi:hypothetical protein
LIHKEDFYHGAVMIPILNDSRCATVRGYDPKDNDALFVVNDRSLVFVKYNTRNRSPWGFSFSATDVLRLDGVQPALECIVALVCGGDGICGAKWVDLRELLQGKAGWVSAKRKFNGMYGVSGPSGDLRYKVGLNHWPSVVFGERSSE